MINNTSYNPVGATQAPEHHNTQDQFAKFINEFWTKEEAYMLELAMALEFSNGAAAFGNTLLAKLVNINSTDFDFNQWLGSSTKGTYTGHSAQEANAKIAAELKKLEAALKALKGNLSRIDQEIAKLKKEGGPAAKAEIKKLDEAKAGIEKAIGSMDNLQEMLEHMKAVPVVPATSPPSFTIEFTKGYMPPINWQTQLGSDESDVATDISTVKSDIENFVTNYSSQGQQQQMFLQLEITKMQQKMSIVTACLRILNQAFMQVTQGINSH